MSNEIEYKDLIAFHPGSYVEEIVEELNITQAEFAFRLGTTGKTISKIIKGEERISKDIANKLAKLTGVSVQTWLNLQANYDAKVIEIENKMDSDEHDVCDLIDFSSLKKNSFIENKRYQFTEKINELRKLLNVSNLARLSEFNSSVSYRRANNIKEKSVVNSNVMLELAMNVARNKTSNKYSKTKLQKILPDIRRMNLEEPSVFYPDLTKKLLDCGIVLVALPNITGAGLNGATKRFKNGSVLLMITDRNKDSDIFWFSLIHELGHIYYEDFYSNLEGDEEYYENEERADEFAANFFIKNDLYASFVEDGVFTEQSITDFAKQLGIHRGIVVGRLQRDNLIEYYEFKNLKVKYRISIT
ncbi:HigA family addiction module antitoxin [Latilactobacillus sakei]|uniref:HigA family addiction module antitoxin n=1 Tax=Latilactobacillus sakei TaxID=1599 RepID=UPI003F53AAA0